MIYARMSCDRCAVAEVEIPLPDRRPEAAVRTEALARCWQIGTIADLCPTCRAIEQAFARGLTGPQIMDRLNITYRALYDARRAMERAEKAS